MPLPTTVLDTCCLINLCAIAQPLETVLKNVPLAFYVARAVEQEEVSIRPRADAPKGDRQPVDLGPCFTKGLLQRCDVETDTERDLYVRLVSKIGLDDGEAMSLAIAASRGWGIASDDRPARRAALTLGVTVLGTPEIVKLWANAIPFATADVTDAVRRIEQLAQFQPRADLPNYDWWTSVRGPAST